mgnify:CR=1 FL=1
MILNFGCGCGVRTKPASPPPARCVLCLPPAVATVAAAGGLSEALHGYLDPQAAYFSTLGLPEALVHWGHPGNMAVRERGQGGRAGREGAVHSRTQRAHRERTYVCLHVCPTQEA